MVSKSLLRGIVGGNYELFQSLPEDLDDTFCDDDSTNGDWFEHVFRMSLFAKVPSLVNIFGYEYSTKQHSIKMSSGTVGNADAIAVFEEKVIAFSCKYRNHDGGRTSYDEDSLHRELYDKYPKFKHFFGYVGRNPHFFNDNEYSINYDKVRECYRELISFVTSHNYNWNEIDEVLRNRRILNLKPHQNDALRLSHEVFNLHKDYLLWHVCRTGKTVTALSIAKEHNAKRILWVTSQPSINYQVTDTIHEFDLFSGWTFFDKFDSTSSGTFENANVVIASFQLLDDTDLYSHFYNENWDMVIIDEVHTHTETAISRNILDSLDTEKRLWLSATPMKNIMLGRFTKDNTHTFTNGELYEQKNKGETSYKNYPKINYFLYSSPQIKKMVKDASKFYDENEFFTFKKLFEVDDSGKFANENQIIDLINNFFISAYNRLSIRSVKVFQQTSSILLFVPEIKMQKALYDLMINLFDKSGLSSTYSVSYTNSNENDSKGLKDWIKVNEANAKRTNIIIAVKQLSVGVTLPSCDMVVHWNDGRSLAEYIQRSERCKNPKESTDQVYVVDFNPHRCIQCHGEIIESITGSSLSVTSITKYLANMNILIYEGEDAFKNIEPFELLDTFIKYNYPLLNFGKLEFDNEIPESLYTLLSSVEALDSGTNSIKILLDDDLGKEESIPNTERSRNTSSSSDKEEKKIEQSEETKQKIQMYLQVAVPILHLLDKPIAHDELGDAIADWVSKA